jgi:hypothetical protein
MEGWRWITGRMHVVVDQTNEMWCLGLIWRMNSQAHLSGLLNRS